MRVAVTRRMLREGLFRCMETKTLSKITVSDLCRESGVNRATFYNHYDSPVMILREVAREYTDHMAAIYQARHRQPGSNDEAALEACLEYIYEQRAEIKVLFSENAEHCLSRFSLEIINENLALKNPDGHNALSGKNIDDFLSAVTTASATFGLIEVWLTMDINKTPKEIVGVLKKTQHSTMFH